MVICEPWCLWQLGKLFRTCGKGNLRTHWGEPTISWRLAPEENKVKRPRCFFPASVERLNRIQQICIPRCFHLANAKCLNPIQQITNRKIDSSQCWTPQPYSTNYKLQGRFHLWKCIVILLDLRLSFLCQIFMAKQISVRF